MQEFNFINIEDKLKPILRQFISKSCDEINIIELKKMGHNDLLYYIIDKYNIISQKLDWYDKKNDKYNTIYKTLAFLLIASRNAINHQESYADINKKILEKSIIYNTLLFINAIRKIFTIEETKELDEFIKYLNDISFDINDKIMNQKRNNLKKNNIVQNIGDSKPGEYIREGFIKLVKDDKISEYIIEKLQEKDYCYNELGLRLPFLIKINDPKEDASIAFINGERRYGKPIFTIKNKTYLITNDLYSRNKIYFEEWFNSIK